MADDSPTMDKIKMDKIKIGPGLTIEVDGIPFQPFQWVFQCDGLAGHLFFTVPAGTYQAGNNNGAYSYDCNDHDGPTVPTDELFCQVVHAAAPFCQVVHAATCCTEYENPHGHGFTEYLYAIAQFIHRNLSTRTTAPKDVGEAGGLDGGYLEDVIDTRDDNQRRMDGDPVCEPGEEVPASAFAYLLD